MGDLAPGGGEGVSTSEEEALRVEAARLLFTREPTFVRGVVNMDGLPGSQLPEVAFAGRSNVGKSSLINALLGRSGVARTSNTPGRTQEINFFDLDHRLMLVDLPGYGFAQAPKGKVELWTQLIRDYLRGRTELRRVLLLIDSRHGLKESDRDTMALLDKAAVVYQIVLTKADKPKPAEVEAVADKVRADIAKRTAAHPHVLITSSEKGTGLAEVRMELFNLAKPEAV